MRFPPSGNPVVGALPARVPASPRARRSLKSIWGSAKDGGVSYVNCSTHPALG